MKNYGDNNSNINNVQFTIGDKVRYHSENNEIHEGTILLVFYEILDDNGKSHRRDSSLVIPPQNPQQVQHQQGSRVRYPLRNNQIEEGTVQAVFYEISDEYEILHRRDSSLVDEDGILHRRDSSLVMPPQNPQHIPKFESVELLTGPYAGSQGILADDRTSHLTVVVGVDDEMKKVHVERWEDMKLFVDRPPV